MNKDNEENRNLPVFPNILPCSIEESTFRVYEAGDFKSKEDVDNLLTLLFEEPECSYYYFVEKGNPADFLLMKAKENGDVLISKTEFFYYRHPKLERGFVNIEVRDGNFRWDWQKEVVEKGPMFMRMTLSLSKRKRTEMEAVLKIALEENIRLKRPSTANNAMKNEPIEPLENMPDGPWQIVVRFFGLLTPW